MPRRDNKSVPRKRRSVKQKPVVTYRVYPCDRAGRYWGAKVFVDVWGLQVVWAEIRSIGGVPEQPLCGKPAVSGRERVHKLCAQTVEAARRFLEVH